MKSKILFILHLPPPIHGAAMMGKYVHDSEIINNTFDCHYINLALAKDLTDIGKGGIKKLLTFLSLLNHIRKEVKRLRPNLCYVTPNAKGGAFYKDFIVVMLLKSMGCKIIAHYHNKGVATRQDKFLDNILYKIFFKNIKVILLAEALYSDIEKYVKRENVFICPNGIPERQSNLFMRNQCHTPYTFLFLSNMIESKGVYTLLDACGILKQKGFQFKCNFVGRWSDVTEELFFQKLKELDLTDSVTAYGAKYGDEKNVFFETADAFIFPTYYETFGLVLLEAMETALPCISTNEGGIPSVIKDFQTGFIVSSRNVEALADKMIWLIRNPDKGLEMGKEGQKFFFEKFTLKSFEERLATILRQTLI